jgi:hypothetical protein
MHRGLPCSKEKLESAMLHEVFPHAPLWQRPLLEEETPTSTFPTCNDDLLKEFKEDSI